MLSWRERNVVRAVAVCMLAIAWSGSAAAQHLQRTYQLEPSAKPDGRIRSVQAASTAEFLDSVGVGTHFGGGYANTPYRKQTSALIDLLIDSGIGHIRDGNTYHDEDLRKIAKAGIRINWVGDANTAIVPTRDYWCNKNGHHDCVLITDQLKTLGPSLVDTVEVLNEVNAYYKGMKWHANRNDPIIDVEGDPNHWLGYAAAYTHDTCRALHSDPVLSSIKCIAPALSGSTAAFFRDGEFWGVADYGAIHPYPMRGNSHGTPVVAYDAVPDYFRWTSSPAINIDEHPWWLTRMAAYVRTSSGETAPIIATETGYHTGTSPASIPEDITGKYVPRIFAEYFRHGIVRTFWYELVDEADHPANPEANFGLLRHDLTPKPGYVALQSLLKLLRASETAPARHDTLAYGITVRPNGAFNRTQYIHDLLLERPDGTFFLLLWHEISDVAFRNEHGDLPSTDAELHPPALSTAVEFPTAVAANVYTYDERWALHPAEVSLEGHKVQLAVGDTVTVVELRTNVRSDQNSSKKKREGHSAGSGLRSR